MADEPKPKQADSGTAESQVAKEMVTLTQEKLDSIISEVMGRAIKKAKAEFYEEGVGPLAKQVEAIREELKKLAEASSKVSKAEEEKADESAKAEVIQREELEALLARKEEEMRKLLEQKESELQVKQNAIQALLHERKRQALEIAAAAAGAIQPAIVAKLLMEHLAEDEQWNIYVKNEKGGRRINDRGDPMTVEEFVQEWLSKNPYMLKPEVRAGGGTVPPAVPQTKSLLDRIREAEQKGNVREAIRLKRQLYEERNQRV